MIYLDEPNKRISIETLLMVFEIAKDKGLPIHFNKVAPGNGGSTAFFNLPINWRKVRIMIAPNVAVVKNKEEQYKADPDMYGAGKNIRFIHQDSIDKNIGIDAEGRHPDIIVIVVESFFLLQDAILKYDIDMLLIDECHSVRKQAVSKSRPKLVNLQNKLQQLLPDTAIVRMTATPNKFDKVDVQLVSPHIRPMKIYVSGDREKVLEDAKALVKKGENVSVFSNNVRNFKKLTDSGQPLIANEIVGKKMKRSIYKHLKFKKDPNSNLNIISSRGFEGWDDEREDVHNFFLEDRSQSWDSASPQQLKQGLERAREGAKSNTYCRLNVEKRKVSFEKGIDAEVDAFLLSNRSPEQMMSKNIVSNPNMANSSKKKNKFLPFLHQEIDENGVVTVTKKVEAVEDYLEQIEWDKNLQNKTEDDFWVDRRVTFTFDDAPQVRTRMTRQNRKIMVENLFYNQDVIRREDVYGEDFKLEIRDFTSDCIGKSKSTKGKINYHAMREKYDALVETFFICKNYDNNYKLSPRQQKVKDLLVIEEGKTINTKEWGYATDWRSYDEFGKLCSDLVKLYKEKQDEKNGFVINDETGQMIGKKTKAEKDADAEAFAENSPAILSMLLCMFANERITVPSNWTVNRDYNLTTKVSFRMIKHVADYLGVSVSEIDIITCNPRILFAICKMALPNLFYGENKENKTKINMLLNNFFFNESISKEKKYQKRDSIRTFKKLGFPQKVIDTLISRWFITRNNFRGQFGSDLAFHEKLIISELMHKLDNGKNEGIIRRHDSVLIFNNTEDLTWVNTFRPEVFPTIGGWFKIDAEISGLEKEIMESLEISENLIGEKAEDFTGKNVANSDVSIEGWLEEEDEVQITFDYEKNKDNFK